MKNRPVHPMEALLLFTAEALAAQYPKGETRDTFERLIRAAKAEQEPEPQPTPEEKPPLPQTVLTNS